MTTTTAWSAVRAGASETDITPALGTHLSGDMARYRPANRIIDPIAARALVVEGPGPGGRPERLCFLSLELLSIEAQKTARLRQAIEKRWGIPGHAVLVHTIQNHSAPGLGHYFVRHDSPYVPKEAWWVFGCAPDYETLVIERVVEAVGVALQRMEPVELALGGMADGRISFNRRFILRDGRVQTQPDRKDLSEVLCPEGPSDPEVGLACFRNQRGEIVAALLHHTGHPVSHFSTNGVSASWPGAWCRRFRELAGAAAVPLMVNGCCGNVNVFNALDPDRPSHDEAIAGHLMQTSATVMASLRYEPIARVTALRRELAIPFGSLPEDTVRAARARVGETVRPEWANADHTMFNVDWLFAAAIVDVAEKLAGASPYPYEIQVFRIGRLALVGLIGEPFVEGQLTLKRQSPAGRTFVAHMCNGYVGYIPTRAAHGAFNFNHMTPDGRPVRRGANIFQLAPDALETIMSQTREMLDEAFRS